MHAAGVRITAVDGARVIVPTIPRGSGTNASRASIIARAGIFIVARGAIWQGRREAITAQWVASKDRTANRVSGTGGGADWVQDALSISTDKATVALIDHQGFTTHLKRSAVCI